VGEKREERKGGGERGRRERREGDGDGLEGGNGSSSWREDERGERLKSTLWEG